MITDPKRIQLKDPGHPHECNVFSYYKFFTPSTEQQAAEHWCVQALKGCVDCKKNLNVFIERDVIGPLREKRFQIAKKPDLVQDILNEGAKKARAIAQQTMAEVRETVFK